MITFTKEQLIASAHARIEFAEMMLAGELEPLKERTWSIELELARIALVSLETEPVVWDYEWASCITCEGPQDFKRVIEREAPPEWAIDEGQARNITPLYSAHPAPVSVPNSRAITQYFDTIALEAAREIMCDVNRRQEFLGGEVQLLSRIQCRIDDACRAAMLQGADGVLTNEDTKRVDELVMWIKRLAYSLRKANPDSKLQSDAMDYLSRKGLIGVEDILR
ncbi:hypothetical protein [Enterobacter asburiae]|uniref:hypothetical protein n=1 Tax=Enterobacter asburiae TaxID=61645 RepID=UPI001E59CBD9|nr:hypothetical protein [Enterobacter asburiae]MCE2000808.1 hypothetical protein [Enterobacter asburiae]